MDNHVLLIAHLVTPEEEYELPEFTLPSGRVLQLKDRATYGDLSDAQDAQRATGNVSSLYFSLGAALSGLSLEEIRSLDADDGRALEGEIQKRAGKRSVEDEAPFGTPSSSTSPTSEGSTTLSPVAD